MGSSPDVIIIGAGLGGLTAGASLAGSGKKVWVLEQQNQVGGYATTIQRKGYSVETGLHQMDGLDELDYKVQIFKELGLWDNLPWIKIPEFCQVHHGNLKFLIPNGEHEAQGALISTFRHEEKAIIGFFKLLSDLRKEIKGLYSSTFEPSAWIRNIKFLSYPLRFPTVVRYQNSSLGEVLDHFFHDEELKLVLAASTAYYHNDPATLSLLYYALGTGSYMAGGGYFLRGGSQELSNALAEIICTNGGQVMLKHEVIEIIREKGNVTGVLYKSGTDIIAHQIKADTVVTAGAIPLLASKLFKDLSDKQTSKLTRYEGGISMLTGYYIMKKPLSTLGWHVYNTFVLDKSIKNLKDLSKALQPADDTFPYFIICDYSQIDSGLKPDGKGHFSIALVDSQSRWPEYHSPAYRAQKEKTAALFRDKLEKMIPGFVQNIEYEEWATPATMEHFTMNPDGAIYGYAQVPKQSGLQRDKGFPQIKGLYYASAWAFPGGGFTGAILSGYRAAQRIIRGAKD